MPTPIPNIWQLQTKGDVDGLILALRHSESSVRRGAAAALRAIGAWQAVPALEAALSVENEWQAHAAISAALQYLDRDIHIETMIKNRDVRGLMKMLNSAKTEDVLAACKALGDIGDRTAVEPLVMVFRNPMLPNKVRLSAADALLELESAPAVVTLLGALRRADNWQIRRNAAAVLGQLGASWATEALIKALDDENQLVRRTSAAALRRFGTPEALHAAITFEATQRKTSTQEMVQVLDSNAVKKPQTGPLLQSRILPTESAPQQATPPAPAASPVTPTPPAAPALEPATPPSWIIPPAGLSQPPTPPMPAAPTPPVVQQQTPPQPAVPTIPAAPAPQQAIPPQPTTPAAPPVTPTPPVVPAIAATPAELPPVPSEKAATSQNGHKDQPSDTAN